MNSSPPFDDNDDDSRDPYEARKERERIRQREQARISQDVGPIPEVYDPELRAEVTGSLKRFCEVVFAETFCLPWSDDHLEVLATTQKIIEDGGQLALAMPRGQGKSSMFLAAVLWAAVTGRRVFIVLIAANNKKCKELLEGIKLALEDNDTLMDLFPEVCHPIRCLDGQTNRAGRQMVDGEKTRMVWTGLDIRLPTVAGSRSSGTYILVRSLTSEGIRGLLRKNKGASLRPDCLLVDDPQTDRSAKSMTMTAERMKLLSQCLKGLAAPGITLAVMAAVTVIRNGDLASQILDRDKRPDWRGRKYQLLSSLPEDLTIWQEYARRRDDELRTSETAIEAIRWLKKRYKKASKGAKANWIHRKEAHQIDGLHYAMDMYTSSDPDAVAAFHCEYQNDPIDDQAAQGLKLTALDIPKRIIGIKQGMAPDWASNVTAFIDVQHKLLYWMVCGWGIKLRGHIMDYGAFPDQKQPQFTKRQPPIPISKMYKGLPLAAAIKRALLDCFDMLAKRTFFRQDGTPCKIDRIGVDSGDGNLYDAILEACQMSEHRNIIWPARGAGINASAMPMREWKVDPLLGETRGERWVRVKLKNKRAMQFVSDVNFWKSTVAGKLAQPIETEGSITLYGERGTWHGQLAQHLTNETFERDYSPSTQRTVDLWELINEGYENEWWDTLVGCAGLASSLGIRLDPRPLPKPDPNKKPEAEPDMITYPGFNW